MNGKWLHRRSNAEPKSGDVCLCLRVETVNWLQTRPQVYDEPGACIQKARGRPTRHTHRGKHLESLNIMGQVMLCDVLSWQERLCWKYLSSDHIFPDFPRSSHPRTHIGEHSQE